MSSLWNEEREMKARIRTEIVTKVYATIKNAREAVWVAEQFWVWVKCGSPRPIDPSIENVEEKPKE